MMSSRVNTDGWVTVKYMPRSAPVSFTGPATGQRYTVGGGEATLMRAEDAAAALKIVRHGRPVFEPFTEAPLPDVRGIGPNLDALPGATAGGDGGTLTLTGEDGNAIRVPFPVNPAADDLVYSGEDTRFYIRGGEEAEAKVDVQPPAPLAPKKRKARAQAPEAE